MSSNLKVNTILPTTGTSIGIGTAGGDTAISGAASVDTNLTLGGDIIHSGDDTKIRFPSNDLITFETAGAEKVRITSDGVLKLTGQTTSLETAGLTYHTNGNLYIRGGTTGAVLQSVDSNEAWIVQNDYISGSTGGAERLRITSTGQVNIGGNYTQTGYIFSARAGAVDQSVQFSNTRTTNGNIHYFGITLSNAGYGQALFGHTGHTTQSEQAAWIGLAGDDVAGGVGIKCFRGGNVIKKGTCAFQAYNGSSQINQSSYVIFTVAGFNIGGNYNTSNGIFTAPITGRYLFTLTGLYTKNNSSATFKLVWHVNNSNSGVASEWQTSNLNGSYNTIGNSSIIFQLSANDTVRLYVEGAGAFHISGIQTRYCGYLLG